MRADSKSAQNMSSISAPSADLFDEHGLLRPPVMAWLTQQQQAIALETSRPTGEESRTFLFLNPREVVLCMRLQQVESCLSQVQQALQAGYYAAGFLSYEAGCAFERQLDEPLPSPVPLLWFGIYDAPLIYHHQHRTWESGAEEAATLALAVHNEVETPERIAPRHFTPALSEVQYHQAIAAIKDYIAAGDTYQVNFTFKLKFPFSGSPADLYCRWRQRQRVAYSALLSCGNHTLLSFSPELFFRVDDENLTLRPMKGTAPRGGTPEQDEQQRQALWHSKKNRAENLMIVDLLRNDAGRIAATGSVQVSRFFELEGYETVWQATSTITAKLRAQTSVLDLMRSLFPCGSVTGAPKIRTMQIIRELEQEPRGIYTGSIGFFAPHLQHAVFNVAIRTVVLDRASGSGEMGVGSGVVWDSVAASEYRECLLKARFLSAAPFDKLRRQRVDFRAN